MPATSDVISITKVTGYLSSNDIAKDSLNGGPLDPRLSILLYMERKALEWKYTYEPTNTTDLVFSTNYVYALCGRYKDKAAILINNGGGGVVIGPTSTAPSSGGGSFYGNLFS